VDEDCQPTSNPHRLLNVEFFVVLLATHIAVTLPLGKIIRKREQNFVGSETTPFIN